MLLANEMREDRPVPQSLDELAPPGTTGELPSIASGAPLTDGTAPDVPTQPPAADVDPYLDAPTYPAAPQEAFPAAPVASATSANGSAPV